MKIKSIEKKPIPVEAYRRLGRRNSASRRAIVYVMPEGETILEDLMNRRQRPHTIYKKLVREEVAKLVGGAVELQWRQKAGCQCGCSPGFLLKKDGYEEYGYTIYIKVVEEGNSNG